MRVYGFCDECKRPKMVDVGGYALATAQARRTMPIGICAECAAPKTRPEQQAKINDLCRQTYHVDKERVKRLAPILRGRRMPDISAVEADRVIRILTELRDAS